MRADRNNSLCFHRYYSCTISAYMDIDEENPEPQGGVSAAQVTMDMVWGLAASTNPYGREGTLCVNLGAGATLNCP